MKRFLRPDGHTCNVSTTVYDALSFGTGILDDLGFWEIGCPECARAHEAQFPEDGECWPHSWETLEAWAKLSRDRETKKPWDSTKKE